jgi:hypothetical protein
MTPRLFLGKSTPTIRAIFDQLMLAINGNDLGLTLALLELRVLLIDNVYLAFAPHHFAVD